MLRSKLLIALGLTSMAPAISSAALLTYFNFNNNSPLYQSAGTMGSLNTTASATFGEQYVQTNNSTPGVLRSNTANGTIYNGSAIGINFANTSTISASPTINGKKGPGYTGQEVTGGSSGYGVYADSTVNQASGDTTTGGSLLLLNASQGWNGKYLTFSLSSANYKTLSLSYAARLTSGVSASDVWSYSTDGTNYNALTTITPTANGTFNTQTLNLSTLSSNALDNQSTFYLRMTYSVGTTAGGSQALDNVQLTGTLIPEPALLGSLGGIALLGLRRKRR